MVTGRLPPESRYDRENPGQIGIGSVPPASIFSYLESRGWRNQGPWGQRPAVIYAKEGEDRALEILAPTRDILADYPSAVTETVAVLAKAEERSQLDIFHDLMGAGADSISVRSANGMDKTPLSLRQSARMLDSAYRMLEAGARSAEKPRATYRGKMSDYVADYLDSVRPLPCYSWKYALTLHSPAPAEIERQANFGDDYVPPFPRRAANALAEGLRGAYAALEWASTQDYLEPFQQAVGSGVSVNLCDSVAQLSEQGQGMVIELTWAGVRISDALDSTFRFSPAAADTLMEAARYLRHKAPSYDEQIVGLVVRLEREPQDFDGKATIASVWNGRMTRMNVEFEPSVYQVVIAAFQDRVEVELDANVHPSGRGYELRDLRPVSEE